MSKVHSLIGQAALVAAFTVAATPSFGQEKYHGRQKESSGQSSSGQQQSGGQSRERAQPRSEAPARSEAPRQQAEAPRPQVGAAPSVSVQPQPAPRAQAVPRAEARREDNSRNGENRGNANRRSDDVRSDNRGGDNRANNSRGYDSGHAVPRGNVYAPNYAPRYSSPRYAPHYVPRGYGYYGSHSYYRPYVYRPYYSIGFGIYAGYPVPYTYTYADPVWVYGYRAPRERVMITPGSAYYGGVALEITPYDADVFVDGEYAGRAEEFDGSTQPLTLASGVHRIEVQAQGYAPLLFNVEIRAGQIIPYRGDLRRY